MGAFLLLAELIFLFLLSRRLTQALYTFFALLTRSRTAGVSATTIILFPGTVIHELSHLFTAEILGVRTGRLTLAPDSIRGKEEIQTGSVAITKTGPFRRAAIGLAPLFAGFTAFVGLSYFLQQNINMLFTISINAWFSSPTTYYLLFITYLLLAVSNSMFPSPEDLKGTPSLGIAIGMLLIAAYVAGFRFSLTGQALELTNRIFSSLLQSTTLVLALNGGILLLMQGFIVLVRKITRRKI